MSFVVVMIVIGTDASYDGRRLDPRCNIYIYMEKMDERRILLGHQSRSGSRCGSWYVGLGLGLGMWVSIWVLDVGAAADSMCPPVE